MIEMLKNGACQLWNFRKEIIALYFVHLIGGLLPGIRMKSMMKAAIGNSTVGKTLLREYNSDTFTDLIYHEGMDVQALIIYFLPTLIFSLLVYIFISGGIISNITSKQNGIINLLYNGWKNLSGFFKTSLLGFLIFAVTCSLLWIPFLLYSGDPIKTYETEKPFIQIVIVLLLFTISLLFIVASWIAKAKSLIVLENSKPFISAFQWLKNNLISILMFCFVIIIIVVFISGIYSYLFSLDTVQHSIWISVILGQFLVISLCKIKVFYWTGLISQD